MTRTVTVAATQMGCTWDSQANIAQADKLVREAAAQGAQIILIQELFETPYFCQKPNPEYLQLATRVEDNPAIKHFQALAKELAVVLPISFFELAASTASRSLMPTAATSASTARVIFRMAPVITRSITSTRATPASRSGRPAMPGLAWVFAGISGSPSARAAWP